MLLINRNILEREIENLLEQELEKGGWEIRVGKTNRNVYRQSPRSEEEKILLDGKFPDFILYDSIEATRPIGIIETKKAKHKDLQAALNQALDYADKLDCRFVFVYSKNIIYSYDRNNSSELKVDNVEIDYLPSFDLLYKFKLNKSSNIVLSNKLKIRSRNELISVFDYANKQLRSAGITIGLTRFTEFSNLLFLKLVSEDNNSLNINLPNFVKWDSFKNKEGDELLNYINDTVITQIDNKFMSKDEESIFEKLKIRDTIALKKIIDKLSELDLSDIKTDIKGDAFEYFIQKYNDTNKDMGEYFTPRHIVDFLVKIADPKFSEKIYDPFCGTGGILISSFNYVKEALETNSILNDETLNVLRKEMLFGSEISSTAKIAKMNMILTGDGHSNIKQQNTFENPIKNTYDLVITNIPFNIDGTTKEGIYDIETTDGNSQALQHILSSLNNSINSRAFVIVPEGVLNNSSTKDIRKLLIDQKMLRGVISLPSGAFLPYTETKTSILCLSKNVEEKVFFSKIKNDGFSLTTRRRKKEGINDLDDFIANNPMYIEDELTGYEYVTYDEILNNENFSFLAFKYEKEIPSGYIKLKDIVEKVSIKNVNGYPTASISNSNYFGLVGGFEYWGDNFSSVTSEDNFDYNVVEPYSMSYNPARINVGSIGINNTKNNFSVSKAYPVFKVVNKDWNPLFLFLLIRHNAEVKQEILSRSFGTVRQSLSFEDFKNISIPIYSLDEQLEFVSKYLKLYDKFVESVNKLDSFEL